MTCSSTPPVEPFDSGTAFWSRTFGAAWSRLEDQLYALPHPLGAEGRLVLQAMAERNGGGAPSGYFDHPKAYPTPQVICWIGETYLPDEQEFIEDVLVAALWLFLFVRLQDDVLDDPASRRDALLIGNVCVQRGLGGLIRQFCGDNAFLQEVDVAWTCFSAATAWERVEHQGTLRSYPDHQLDRLGEKFAPIRLPIGAILHRAGKRHLVPAYTRALQNLGTAVQMGNDLANRYEDLRAHNFTYFLTLAGGEPDRALAEGTAAERCLLVAERHLMRSLQALPDGAPDALRSYLLARCHRVRREREALTRQKLGLGQEGE